MTAPPLARTVHVEHCMGTTFSIDIRDPGDWADAIAEVVAWLHHVDRVFSTYRPDSDISRMRRGELSPASADAEIAHVLSLCADVQAETDGYFSALRGGRVDPTGLVKGWAVERAGRLLHRHGARNHAINGGGDIQLAGGAAADRAWTVGICDPADRQRVLTTVSGRDIAVATSGVAERGAHITDPFTGRPATTLAAVTVVGPSLTRADAYATAAFVMGEDALRWIGTVPGYHALIVTTDGRLRASAGWPRADQASCSAWSPAHSVWNDPSLSTRL